MSITKATNENRMSRIYFNYNLYNNYITVLKEDFDYIFITNTAFSGKCFQIPGCGLHFLIGEHVAKIHSGEGVHYPLLLTQSIHKCGKFVHKYNICPTISL